MPGEGHLNFTVSFVCTNRRNARSRKMTSPILVEHKDDVTDITLNTPDNGNLVSNEMGAMIIDAVARIAPETKLIRLLGNGPDFCRGRVSPMPQQGARVTAYELQAVVADPALRLYDALYSAPVPVLGVVSGRALAVGAALAAACDLTIATEDSVFQVSEMLRDIPPLLVMTAMMPKVPLKAIAQLVYSAEVISAAQAREWGIVTKVVSQPELSSAVDDLTSRFKTYSVVSIRAIKEYLRAGKEMNQQARTHFASHAEATSLSARYR
jgi:enoyl-CoA hydratase